MARHGAGRTVQFKSSSNDIGSLGGTQSSSALVGQPGYRGLMQKSWGIRGVRRRFGMATTVLGLSVALIAAGCGNSDGDSASTTTAAKGTGGETIRVPADFKTISEAVSAAKTGDMVLVGAGIYKEMVTVETEGIVIRGEDRNKVIIDGEFERENGIMVLSDNVAVENLTVRNNTSNGVYFTGDYDEKYTLSGYRASYVTAYNNGLYGIYAFNAQNGQIDHSYGSGHPDSAFYIGQCEDCNAVLTDNLAERNMLGYSGTNSTGVLIVNSVWRNNRAGIVPNSLYSEKLYPNRGTTIIGNTVLDNNATDAPNNTGIAVAYGNGIVLGGVSNSLAERNLVTGHKNAGVVITDMPTSTNPATEKEESFKPENNKVINNTVADNTMDLAYLTVNYASAPFGNCYEGNKPTTSFPEDLEKEMPCEGTATEDLGDLTPILGKLTPAPPDVDYKTVKAPGDQENMPDAMTAPIVDASAAPLKIDVDSIKTPTGN